jgi:hypothetical protein
MEKKAKLKPCPFCGFVPKGGILVDTRPVMITEEVKGCVLVCPRCVAKGPLCSSQVEAVNQWNRRTKCAT